MSKNKSYQKNYNKAELLISKTLHIEPSAARLGVYIGTPILLGVLYVVLIHKSKLQKDVEKICGEKSVVKFQKNEVRLYPAQTMTDEKHNLFREAIRANTGKELSEPEFVSRTFFKNYYCYRIFKKKVKVPKKAGTKLKEGQSAPAFSEIGEDVVLDFYRQNSVRVAGPSGSGKTQATMSIVESLKSTTQVKLVFVSTSGSVGLPKSVKESAEVINSQNKELLKEKLIALSDEKNRRMNELEKTDFDHYRFIEKDSAILYVFDELENTLSKKDIEIIELINNLLNTGRKANIWFIFATQSSQLSASEIKQSLIEVSFFGKMTSTQQAQSLGLDFKALNRNDLKSGKLICVGLFNKPLAVQFRKVS